ncbi:MAG TPA: pilus assembly protein TadG-related protein [Tepidiformaceae bacterium]|nr:pilus assembly protein TadG-related protein [Tepidiformaceae bacterium]
MSPFRRFRFDRIERESGQSLVLFALGTVAFIALVAMSVDVGRLVFARTDLQKAADAAAFAGIQELPESAMAAQAVAESYVALNVGGRGATPDVVVSQTYSYNDTIAVTASREVDFHFLKVIGMERSTVRATAKVTVSGYTGGTGLVPWGFVSNSSNNCFEGFSGGLPQFQQNTSCTLKDGAPGEGGDFGGVVLDGTGADNYRNGIKNGSSKAFQVGDKIDSQTGNLTGPTWQGTQDRFAKPPPAGCPGNERNDVLIDNADGSVSIRPGCEESARIVLIPVIDKLDNPNKSTILGFAFLFVESVKNQGGHTNVTGEFVEFVTEIPGGIYTGAAKDGVATLSRLVE